MDVAHERPVRRDGDEEFKSGVYYTIGHNHQPGYWLSAIPNEPDKGQQWTMNKVDGGWEMLRNTVQRTRILDFPRRCVRLPNKHPNSLPSSSPHLNGGAIAGIVVGAVVLISAVVFIMWFLLRKKRHARNEHGTPHEVRANEALSEKDADGNKVELGVPALELPCRDNDPLRYRTELDSLLVYAELEADSVETRVESRSVETEIESNPVTSATETASVPAGTKSKSVGAEVE
ncbi:hypothetical protein DE146DRAFT_630566 [Phaeosphaeria sp. MPI-PUGE-AT-0046c]|nr:hypothetical protein DE146DRAFT_630566 [Phaeosphaeria sp. MPI-PUGE-AT-0046c]